MKQNNSGFPWWILLVGAGLLLWWWSGMPGLPPRQPAVIDSAPAPQVQPPPIEVVVIIPTFPAPSQEQEFQTNAAAEATQNDGSQDHTAATSGAATNDGGNVTILGGENAVNVYNNAGTSADAADTSGVANAGAEVTNAAGQVAGQAAPLASPPGPDINVRFWARDVADVSAVGASVSIFDWQGTGNLINATTDTEGRVQTNGITGALITVCWTNPVGTIFSWQSTLDNQLSGDIQLLMRTDLRECPNPTQVP